MEREAGTEAPQLMKRFLSIVAALAFGLSVALFAIFAVIDVNDGTKAAVLTVTFAVALATGLYLVRELGSAVAEEVERLFSRVETPLKNVADGLGVIGERLSSLATAEPGARDTVVPATAPLRIDPQVARSVLGFNRGRNIVFVYPPRQEEPGTILPRMAGEDFMAIAEMLDLVGAAGFTREAIQMTPVDRQSASIQANERDNLVLICASNSNPMTNRVLGELRERCGLGVDFRPEKGAGQPPGDAPIPAVASGPNHSPEEGEKVEAKPAQYIAFYGEEFRSETYEVERKLRARGDQPWRGEMTDYGLIVRAPNPLNPRGDTAALIIAGIRGIGTWGAACYLCQNVEDLQERYGGADFAAVISVRYNNFRIAWTSLEDSRPLVCR